MAKIAVLGYGVVGSGVVELAEKNQDVLVRSAGCPVELGYILDRKDLSGTPYGEKQAKEFADILRDPSVDVVVEAMGGMEPAFGWLKAALLAGKHVVTSNKELVAEKGAELLAAAKAKNVNFLFEASVAGGIPILHPLHACLGANHIQEVAGILNGTTNYILTKMFGEGKSFDEALADAQRLGYAEADPTADVEGIDACRKLCIMASMVSGKQVLPSQVHTCGIRGVDAADVAYANAAGYRIKLIGRLRMREDSKVEAQVTPALLKQESQLAGIDDVFNGVLVRGDAVGDLVFYGRGAGSLPTASAVLSDVCECLRSKDHLSTLDWAEGTGDHLVPHEEYPVSYYLRVEGPASMADSVGYPVTYYLSVENPVQMAESLCASEVHGLVPLKREHAPAQEFAFLMPSMTETEAACHMEHLREKGVKVLSAIPVLDL